MVFSYDDRGMGVIGPNTALLSQLYHYYHAYLLDHERPVTGITFENI
ncbi:DUF3885 domain-containing protein [Pseudomonas floridensis]